VKLFVMIFCLLSTQTVSAATVFYHAQSPASSNKGAAKTTELTSSVAVQSGKFKRVNWIKKEMQSALIFDQKTMREELVDYKTKTYAQVNIRRIRDLVKKAAMKGAPRPQLREMPVPLHIKHVKWPCKAFEVLVAGKKRVEACVAKATLFGLSSKDLETLENSQITYTMDSEGKEKGIIVWRRSYKDGKPTQEELLYDFSQNQPDLPASAFSVPKGFKLNRHWHRRI
jgi:hypothetical protein